MPAKAVNGVSIGDKFEVPDLGIAEVLEFITPPNHSKHWKAKIRFDSNIEQELEVSELQLLRKVTL
jgi:hypothetical protein